MMLLLLWLAIVALLLGASAYAAHRLSTLPYAPACPACHGVTAQPLRVSALDRVLARCGGAAARNCAQCGWSGRMRWRLAQEHARGK